MKALLGKANTQSAIAIGMVATLCYLALTGAVSGETFLAATVGGAIGWAFNSTRKA